MRDLPVSVLPRLGVICAVAAFVAACRSTNVSTATPIKHLVVIYDENVSFDHYFATYPRAANPVGEPACKAARSTPSGINTLANANLLTNNPNDTNSANGTGAANPFRLDL